MRFASVYRSFDHLGDFEAEIAELRAHQALSAAIVPRYGGAHDPAPPVVAAAR